MNTRSHLAEANRVFSAEIEGLKAALISIQSSFDSAVEAILECKGKVVVTGLGKSGIIGHKIAATFASTGTPAVFLNAGEALHGDIGIIARNDVILMLSNSANTLELARMLPSLRKIGVKRIGLFGSSETALAQQMDVLLDASIDSEACPLNLAPMTSSTVALVIGDSLAAALIKARGFAAEDFAIFHPGGILGRRLLYRVRDVMQSRERVPVVSTADSFDTAVKRLGEGSLGAVMICDRNDVLAGIVVEADVRRHFLKRTSPKTPIVEIMTKNPKVINPDVLLGDALEVMERDGHKVYVLPVVDEKNILQGLLRMHDIVAL